MLKAENLSALISRIVSIATFIAFILWIRIMTGQSTANTEERKWFMGLSLGSISVYIVLGIINFVDAWKRRVTRRSSSDDDSNWRKILLRLYSLGLVILITGIVAVIILANMEHTNTGSFITLFASIGSIFVLFVVMLLAVRGAFPQKINKNDQGNDGGFFAGVRSYVESRWSSDDRNNRKTSSRKSV